MIITAYGGWLATTTGRKVVNVVPRNPPAHEDRQQGTMALLPADTTTTTTTTYSRVSNYFPDSLSNLRLSKSPLHHLIAHTPIHLVSATIATETDKWRKQDEYLSIISEAMKFSGTIHAPLLLYNKINRKQHKTF